MHASVRASRATANRDDFLRIASLSLAIFGVISFSVDDANRAAVWIFRIIAFGLAGTFYVVSRRATRTTDATSPQFEEGQLVLGGHRIDLRVMTAAAIHRRETGGIVHLWEGEHETILTADAELFPILCGALHPTLLDAPRTYLPSGPIRSIAKLMLDREALSFPTDWVRGQGMTRIERVPWPDFKRAYLQDGYLVIQRKNGELLGPGLSVATDLEEIVLDEIKAMRSPVVDDSVPNAVLLALPRLASSTADSTPPEHYRELPDVTTEDLFMALAQGPLESRVLAAQVLVARGKIPKGAALFVQRSVSTNLSRQTN